MGVPITLCEKLSLINEEHWIWEPHMFGIRITDDFMLLESGKVIQLRIHSEFKPKGLNGKTANFAIGWALKRMMMKEWKAASVAFRTEAKVILLNYDDKYFARVNIASGAYLWRS